MGDGVTTDWMVKTAQAALTGDDLPEMEELRE